MATNPPIAVFEIKQYMVIFRQLEMRSFNGMEVGIRAIIRCTGSASETNQEYRMDIYFLGADSVFPEPIVDLDNHNGSIFLPIDNMALLIDVLRNESPLFGHLRGDNPQWTSITTTNEPVGAGDEDFA